jgi:hypothetical protein
MKVTEAINAPATKAPYGKVKLEVYGGPHHGRLLYVPEITKSLVSIAASLPKGDTFRETRTNPRAYAGQGRVVYERKRAATDGKEYLSFVDVGDVQMISVEFDNTEVQFVSTRHTY